ncbi:MAG: radical SAM protein [Proteobacteria bacterium]|nr:radical SAM protein [Pseudomonadota bacterium]
MKVVLVSTYDLGHQPFGLASPAAWLREAGASVTCIDLAVEALKKQAVQSAALVAIYLPMHTATRLASALLPRIKALNPRAHLCCYGLYAPMNEAFLRRLGVQTVLGGEFEAGLASLYARLAAGGPGAPAERQSEPVVSFAKLQFRVPDRTGLPPLSGYAHLELGDGERRTAGYTEASRGCKHMCRHCPVVPVYGGRFRIVQRDVVMEDIRRQVAAGARHITFGDPDFFNGVGHALRLVAALHRAFPHVSYDATIKVEHLLKHARHLPTLAATGCLFVTTAVESIDDDVLRLLDKGHTRADFVRVVGLARDAGLTLSPSFMPFTPWTSLRCYRDLLALVAELGLIDHVAPVQLAIRMLVPAGSRLLELAALAPFLDGYDAAALSHRWSHPDPEADRLHARVRKIVAKGEARGASRRETFAEIWRAAHRACGAAAPALPKPREEADEIPVPRLSEPWYCCAEPTEGQFARI